LKLRLLVVGKGARELDEYKERFIRRIRPFCDIEIVELPEGRGKQVTQRKAEEEKLILDKAADGFVLFDECGRSLSSTDWAEALGNMPAGVGLDFVIGGADGVSDAVHQKAGRCWSLSPLTLPHQLVRVIVLEQLYRAFTIIQGHPYHRV
jgi:23S rRNA (pseudouridine1915-N3)-methyltransferase